ncbi:MAG TPA: ornithine cyclodeaminase family protein [Burkholderiaceae bacterium]|nr:ornithine cyclodeaminase family protein [Burkholderiaceae bacterium]
MELRVYGAAEVHAALPWARLADALEAAFVAARTEVPQRHAHALGGDGTLLLMPAWSARAIGVKLVTVMPGAAARGAGTVQASYLLLDRATGVARALIDGEALTLRRTAAASALAARHLARPDARRLLVVGAGRLAPWMARAHAALRPGLTEIGVWARRSEAAEGVARELAAEGLPARAAIGLEAAVRGADIVCCATTSTTPLVHGAWLAPGAHLDLVGGFRPEMREVDDEALARSCIVVDTAAAQAEAGDLLQPRPAPHIAGNLADLLAGRIARPADAAACTLFKSVGTALEDLAAAELVLATAP